jgi:hypothetical protein
VRIAGIVLLVIAAGLVVPALTYAAYLWMDAGRDPAGLMTPVALLVAGLGACVGGIGGAAVYVGGRKDG